MEIPQRIDIKPVPCDLAREHCEQIYGDFREASHISIVDLMMMAYRKGQQTAYRDALSSLSGYKPPKSDDDFRKHDDTPAPRYVASLSNGYEGGCEP